jgi:C4-dicarboxylate transporter DctQ subunit
VKFLNSFLSGIENLLAGGALAAAAALTILEVLLRYLFGYSIYWSHEAVIFLIIYSTFIGASIALRYNEHVGVDLITFFLGPLGKRAIKILSASLLIIYSVVYASLGWIMVTQPHIINTVSPSLRIPLWIVQMAVPIGMTLVFLRACEMLYKVIISVEVSREIEGR